MLGIAFCSPLVFYVRVRMFDLSNIGSGCSEGVSVRTQIHPIWRYLIVPWRSNCFLVVKNWFLFTEAANDDTRIFL